MQAWSRRIGALTLLFVGALGSIATSAPEPDPALFGSRSVDQVHLRLVTSGAHADFLVTARVTLPASAQGLDLQSDLTVYALAEDELGEGQLELYACEGGEELAFGEWAAPYNLYLSVPGVFDVCEPGVACVVEVCGTVTGVADDGAMFGLGASSSLASGEEAAEREAGERVEIELTLDVEAPVGNDGEAE